MQKIPSIGIGVLIKKDELVLFGKRKGAHGGGLWAPPGGRLEFGESLEQCAKREVFEETGLMIKNVQLEGVTNSLHHDSGQHCITLYVSADYVAGEAQLKEPEKCEGWRWFTWDAIPQPLFLPLPYKLEGSCRTIAVSDLIAESL